MNEKYQKYLKEVKENSDYRIVFYNYNEPIAIISNIDEYQYKYLKKYEIIERGIKYYIDLNGVCLWFDEMDLRSL